MTLLILVIGTNLIADWARASKKILTLILSICINKLNISAIEVTYFENLVANKHFLLSTGFSQGERPGTSTPQSAILSLVSKIQQITVNLGRHVKHYITMLIINTLISLAL